MSHPGPHIFVSDLRLQARVGVNPGEDEANQPVGLDIWVGVAELEQAATSERLRHTVDYVGVARAARKVVEARHYPLVETLATRVAEAVLERPGATWARVRLRKLKCLRYAAAAGAEVELQRDKSTQENTAEHPAPCTTDVLHTPEEIVIVGGGAAGLAAALWCQRLGHPALLVDPGPQLGGQLHLVHGQMKDLPAMQPMTGVQLARQLWRQFVDHGGRWLPARLHELETGTDLCRLRLDVAELASRAVILCTGVRRRLLEVPGERTLVGRGILHTGAKGTAHLGGHHVVVVGGGDAACENAMILQREGARVTLIHRGSALTARSQFCRGIEQNPGITVLCDTEVVRFQGEHRLEQLILAQPEREKSLAVDAVLVRVGWIPNSEGLPASWLDERGFVRTDPDGRVRGERRAFIAGDVAGRLAPSVATAYGSAAVAVRATVHLLELSD